MDAIAHQLHPLHAELFDQFPASYYWSTYQSEWATDLVSGSWGVCFGLERPTRWKGKRVRGLHPFSGPDSTLFQVVSRGEWALRGFRNGDLQRLLFSHPATSVEEKRRPLGLGKPSVAPPTRPPPDSEGAS